MNQKNRFNIKKLKSVLKARLSLLFFGAPLVFTLILGYYIYPNWKIVRHLNEGIQERKSGIEITRLILKDNDRLKENIKNFKESIEKLFYLAFPKDKLGPIYGHLGKLSGESGLLLSEFAVGEQRKAEGVENKDISKRTFTLKFIGSYESLKNFLAKVESSIRLVEVEGTSIAPTKEKNSEGLFDISLEVTVYTR